MGNSTDPGSAGEMAIVTPSEVVVAPVPVPVPVVPPVRASLGFGVWLRDLIIALAISAFIIIFLYQPVKVEGTSMMPSLVDQERIFINKFVYRFGMADIGRSDTVVFWFPGDPSKSYIKRVIGVPGDTVELSQGAVFVNGRVLAEP